MTSCACGDGGGNIIGLHINEYIYFLVDFFFLEERGFAVTDFMIFLISFFILFISFANYFIVFESMIKGELAIYCNPI